MGSPARFQPDGIYCVYCHAPASGPCAVCRALVCVDCCEISGGSVHKAAVCVSCVKKGRGDVGWRLWTRVFGPWVLGLVVLGLIGWLIKALVG